MAGKKHGPIELGKYLEIHDAAMRRLESVNRYVLPRGADELTLDRFDRGVMMSGPIRCVGGVTIEVTKLVAILAGEGDGAMVQTASYSYHVTIEGLGNLLRYCSPHGHRPYHHRHGYDVLRRDAVGKIVEVDAEERPTLAEVICEACGWYHENLAAIDARRGER